MVVRKHDDGTYDFQHFRIVIASQKCILFFLHQDQRNLRPSMRRLLLPTVHLGIAGTMPGHHFEMSAHLALGAYMGEEPRSYRARRLPLDGVELDVEFRSRRVQTFDKLSELSSLEDEVYYLPDGRSFPTADAFIVLPPASAALPSSASAASLPPSSSSVSSSSSLSSSSCSAPPPPSSTERHLYLLQATVAASHNINYAGLDAIANKVGVLQWSNVTVVFVVPETRFDGYTVRQRFEWGSATAGAEGAALPSEAKKRLIRKGVSQMVLRLSLNDLDKEPQ